MYVGDEMSLGWNEAREPVRAAKQEHRAWRDTYKAWKQDHKAWLKEKRDHDEAIKREETVEPLRNEPVEPVMPDLPVIPKWRDLWKYGGVIKGMGCCPITFDWGPDATPEQKSLLEDCINSMSKWASKVEAILDNPPDAETRKVLREIKRIQFRR